MGEFFLQLGKKPHFNVNAISQALMHFDDFRDYSLQNGEVSIVLTSCENPEIWAPFHSSIDSISVFMAGRIALTEKEWQIAAEQKGEGGLAGRYVHKLYTDNGIKGFKELNGAYTIIVIDKEKNTVNIVTDRCGMFQCFHCRKSPESFFFSSNSDVLAKFCDVSKNLDMTSLSEFLMIGNLSFPYTYYSSIRSLEHRTIFTYRISQKGAILDTSTRYFEFAFKPDSISNLDAIAEELASAIRSSVQKRNLPMFGKCAVALSGGLDSRTLLGAIEDRSNVVAITFFDEENYEFRIAKRIARNAGVDLIPLRRDFDHYGNTSEACIEIGCAMSDCFANHFLGFRNELKKYGIMNILSGFYFDYMFKALALDRQMVPYMGTKYHIEKEGDFKLEHYQSYFMFGTEISRQAQERMIEILSSNSESVFTERARLEIACKRTFPLCYTPTNAQTIVSQKVFPWYLPIVDSDVLNVYLRIPVAMRINRILSLKLAKVILGKKSLRIPDTNTGLRVDASQFRRMVKWHMVGINMKFKKYFVTEEKGIATEDSWPDHEYYMKNSQVVKKLWERPNSIADEVFLQIMGPQHFKKDINEYKGFPGMYLFSRLFTLKLWMDRLYNK